MSSPEPVTQTGTAGAQEPLSATNGTHQPLTLDEARALPALNGPDVIMRLFQIKKSRFHVLDQQHAFDFLAVTPSITAKRFSGVLIAQYVAGELVGRTFGRRKRA